MRRTALIVGGAGFLGRHLTETLAEAGYEVLVFDLRAPAVPIPDVTYAQGNILDDASAELENLVKRADQVFHLAAMVGVHRAMTHPLLMMQSNVLGTYKILTLCAKHRKPLVLSSSSYVYGKNPHLPFSERSALVLGDMAKKSWIYAASKLAQEAFALSFFHEKGLDVRIFRLFNCVGAGQDIGLGNVVPKFVEAALDNEPLEIYWDGKQTRTFVHVRDATKAIRIIAQKGKPGEIYNVGGTAEVTVLELAERVIRIAGSQSPIKYADLGGRYDGQVEEPRRRKPVLKKLFSLGFEFSLSLDDAISEAIEFARQAKCVAATG